MNTPSNDQNYTTQERKSGEAISRARFRNEVLEHRANQWLGNMTLARSIPFAIYSTAALCLTALIIAFLVFGSYAKTESVGAVISPEGGPRKVTASVDGDITEVFVNEGEFIRKGMPIFRVRISNSAPIPDGEEKKTPANKQGNDVSFETIAAPVSGRIYTLTAKKGGTVSAYDREPIATIGTTDALIIEANVDSAVQAVVKTGDTVQVELDAFKSRPKAKLSAVVVAVAAEPTENFDLMTGGTKRSYKIVMRMNTSTSKIPNDELLGKTVQVKFLMEKRKLYEWLLDPLQTLFGN